MADLSDQERAVAEAVGRTHSYKLAADELGLSVHTVRSYARNVRLKIGGKGTTFGTLIAWYHTEGPGAERRGQSRQK